jgi:hypothetical protein
MIKQLSVRVAVAVAATGAVVGAVLVGVPAGSNPTALVRVMSHPHTLTTREAIDAQPVLWAEGRWCTEDMPACWDSFGMGNGWAGRGPVRMG